MSDTATTASWVSQMTAAGARFRALSHTTAPVPTPQDSSTATDVARAHLLLQAVITKETGTLQDDDLMMVLVPAWRRLLMERRQDPHVFDAAGAQTAGAMLAEVYEEEGWDQIVLSPRPGDNGFDVLARRQDFGTVRFIDELKVLAAGHPVAVDDLRGFLGQLPTLPATSIGVVSTTAEFAPEIREHPLVKPLLATRLLLRSRVDLLIWMNATKMRIEDGLLRNG